MLRKYIKRRDLTKKVDQQEEPRIIRNKKKAMIKNNVRDWNL